LLKSLNFRGKRTENPPSVDSATIQPEALVAAILLGPREVAHAESKTPHNVPFVILGASLLWFGWFGFNAGSALSAGGLAS
jgi:ammonia channel protein AmtB